jgi:hypothetical protein
LDAERGKHREEVEDLGGGVNTLTTQLKQREEELELLRANASSYIGNILVQESGQGGGGNVDNIFDATLIQAAGNRNKLNTERDRHREEVEELGRNVNVLAMKLRLREEKSEPLRANASSYIGNILFWKAGQGGGGKVNDIFDATLIQASGDRNKLDAERGRHREEVEELGGDVNMLATKLRQREELNMYGVLLTKHVSNFCGNNVQLYYWSKGLQSPQFEFCGVDEYTTHIACCRDSGRESMFQISVQKIYD